MTGMQAGTEHTTGSRLAAMTIGIGAGAMTIAIVLDALSWSEGSLTSNVGADLVLAPVAAISAALGWLLTTRRSGNRIGRILIAVFFASGWLVLADGYATYDLVAAPGSLPAGGLALWLENWLWVPVVVGVMIWIPLLFPEGRLPSRRWRLVGWLVAVMTCALCVAIAFMPGRVSDFQLDNPYGIETPGNLFGVLFGISAAGLLTGFLLGVAAVVHRFRHARGLERQQLTWLAFGGVVIGVGLLLTIIVSNLVPWAFNVFFPLALTAVVLSVGLAILRYRLYEIDRIVSRTISYGALTMILAGFYVLIVLAGQALSSSFAGGSNLAIAVSTLIVAALFLPLRSRIQSIVDRRFNRRRYDAQRTLEAFGARLREQVELEALTGDLRTVVGETMQPAHTGVWLRSGR